jgi:MEMO1 family protein
MSRIRPPAVAGRFYPGDTRTLAADVHRYLADPAPWPQEPVAGPHAVVVPHAGYVYSGPTAGVAYRRLPGRQADVTRVLLLGPAHYVPVRGLALSSADAWRTPLGDVALDTAAGRDLVARARGLGTVAAGVDDAAHAPEHSLEVQLPFLQATLPDAALLPVLVGEGDADAVARVLQPLWDDPGTVVVVSTDLSHYHPQAQAQLLDARTADAVVRADAAAIGDRDACGCRPLRAVLRLARDSAAPIRLLDLRTSADTAGDPGRVVGYGAFAVAA